MYTSIKLYVDANVDASDNAISGNITKGYNGDATTSDCARKRNHISLTVIC